MSKGYDPRDPRVMQKVDRMKNRILLRTSTCFKACFLGEDGRLTYEGERALADLRTFARLHTGKDSNSFLRDLDGKIDPLSLARIEGRREAVRRIANFLNLDAHTVETIMEVDSE